MSKAVEAKQITCIQISKGAPSINHLQFVDDSTDMLENRRILDLLETYEQASG